MEQPIDENCCVCLEPNKKLTLVIATFVRNAIQKCMVVNVQYVEQIFINNIKE